MGWKECLEAQQLKGAPVVMDDADFEVRISVNRQQFGSAQVAYRDRTGAVEVQGPKDTGHLPNPMRFRFAKRTGPKGGQCGWIIKIARINEADPFPDVDVEIVQPSGSKFSHSYVCPSDEIPASGIEIHDFVNLV
jgi:hypothetical protein